MVYPLVLTFFLMKYVTGLFDADLFNDRYWKKDAENSFLIPSYRFRRAYLYLVGIGSHWAARRRFPGYEFRGKVPSALVPFCVLHVFSMFYVVAVLIPLYWIRFACGQ